MITYYQQKRHLFGKLKLQIIAPDGKVVGELPASTRRGLNRVVWTMHLDPPHVPPAVQLAQAGTQGARALPGVYTVRLEKNGKTYDTQITIGLDTRVKWTLEGRRAQYEAAMQVQTLFNDESILFARILDLREEVEQADKGRAAKDPAHHQLEELDKKLVGPAYKDVAAKYAGQSDAADKLATWLRRNE